jgi:hypothetical protein
LSKERAAVPNNFSLDSLYHQLIRIYDKRNRDRSRGDVFMHMVERVGALAHSATRQHAPNDDARALASALAWFFALCAKLGVRSVEQMVWSKYPGICPYCLQCPHNAVACRHARLKGQGVDWEAVHRHAVAHMDDMPETVEGWVQMFAEIYPPTDTEDSLRLLGRFVEELGELAEAIRVFDDEPTYFLNEAADVVARLLKLQVARDFSSGELPRQYGERLFSSFFGLYGAGCPVCRNRPCDCEILPEYNQGRIGAQAPPADCFAWPFVTPRELQLLAEGQQPSRPAARSASTPSAEEADRQLALLMQLLQQHVTHTEAAGKALLGEVQALRDDVLSMSFTQEDMNERLANLAMAVQRLDPDVREGLVQALTSMAGSVSADPIIKMIWKALGGDA